MATLDKIGRYDFLAEPFHCDFSKKLFMGGTSETICSMQQTSTPTTVISE